MRYRGLSRMGLVTAAILFSMACDSGPYCTIADQISNNWEKRCWPDKERCETQAQLWANRGRKVTPCRREPGDLYCKQAKGLVVCDTRALDYYELGLVPSDPQ